MEGTIEYKKEEVENIVVAYHQKLMPAPAGMRWVAIEKTYGGVSCELMKEDGGQ